MSWKTLSNNTGFDSHVNRLRPTGTLDRTITLPINTSTSNLVMVDENDTLLLRSEPEPQTNGMIPAEDWDKLQKYFNSNNSNRQPWEIIPYRQRQGEAMMYQPTLPIIYLNRAYMSLELQQIDKPKIIHKFPRPTLDNRIVRKTSRIILTIDANTHSYYNVWGVDYRFEPTFQLSYPRNAFTLRLLR